MSDRSVAISPLAFSSTVTTSPAAVRPAAARTKWLLEGPVLTTLLRLGAGQGDVANALALHAFVLALGLAATFSTVLLLGAPVVFRWMGGHGEMLSAAFSYANVAFSGAVSICMLNLLGSAVRGTGNMSLPASVIVGSVIAHILISPLLIFGWGPVPALGPAGAGWGPIF